MTTQPDLTQRIITFALPAILILGLLLPLPSLVENPLHHDEALYAHWAALIAGGQDTMLNTVPVDKPPLFIYAVALAFRLFGPLETVSRFPSLLAHLGIIALTFNLGKTLYNHRIGLIAALLVALSPFSLLFAATTLTDPLMVACVMGGAWAASCRKPVLAGLGIGLAAATKQQGIFFLPLILGLLLLPNREEKRSAAPRTKVQSLIICSLTFAASLLPPLIWDAARTVKPGFWLQSSLSYGPVVVESARFTERLIGFVNLLEFATANKILTLIFLAGLPILLMSGLITKDAAPREKLADWVFAGFSLGFVFLHALVTFQIWDRYLLGLIPLLALLLARIIHLPEIICRAISATVCRRIVQSGVISVAAAALILGLIWPSTVKAVRSEYPVGGDHGAYYGATDVAAYLRGHAGANVTLYHRWLGAHWRYYLNGFPYDFRYWQSAEDLAAQASRNAGGTQYIAFPAWQSTTLAQLSLASHNLTLVPVFKTFKPDGTPAIFLYQITVPTD